MKFRIVWLFLMATICSIQGCVNDNDPKGPLLTVGDHLPQFSVEMSDGLKISTADFIGKAGVIVFFNTNCSDCREELPVIQQLWEEFKNNPDILIIPIAREEKKDEIETYWKENNLSMPFSPQDNKDIYNLFAPSVIPRIFITDREGIIIFSSGDSDMPGFSQLKNIIESILS